MSGVIGFFLGAFLAGTVLAVVFGAFHLEAEQKAYWQGYRDALQEVENETDI